MNKKILFFSLLIASFFILSGCTTKNTATQTPVDNKQPAEKVEVFLFHATQRCTTCIAIGKLAGETVSEYFQPELRDEEKDLLFSDTENEKLLKENGFSWEYVKHILLEKVVVAVKS